MIESVSVRIYQPCNQCSAINDHGQICERCERIAQQAARIVALENALSDLIDVARGFFTTTQMTRPDVVAEIHKAIKVLAGRGASAPAAPKDGDQRAEGGDHA